MPLYFDKLLTQLAYPLCASIVLCLLAAGLVWRGWRRLGAGLLVLATAWLGFWSMPVASDALRHSLEARHPEQSIEALSPAEAVVVLGGAMHPPQALGGYPDLKSAADRIWHAARIYHAGLTPWVVLSGGSAPWQAQRASGSEASVMREFLLALGVPEEAVLLEERSLSTHENALYTAQILGEQGIGRVLLVTSALHMPRALATFRAAGINATPAPTDFEVRRGPRGLLGWLPDAAALEGSSRALKEYLGLWVYRLRGSA